MDSAFDIANLASEFVCAYYTAAVYDFRSTIKFYDPEKAQIYRQSLPDGKPAKVNDAKHFIAPDLRGHERLTVLNYSYNSLPLNNNNSENQTRYFNVIVIGQIVKNEKEGLLSQFSQFFTLEIINNERVAIISDSLTVIPQNDPLNNNANEPAEAYFEIDRRPTFLNQPKRQQKQQQNQSSQEQQQNQPPVQQQQQQSNNQTVEDVQPNQNPNKNTTKKRSKTPNRFVYTPPE